MTALILNYFRENSGRFWGMLAAHVQVSILSLGIAVLIGVTAGFLCMN